MRFFCQYQVSDGTKYAFWRCKLVEKCFLALFFSVRNYISTYRAFILKALLNSSTLAF